MKYYRLSIKTTEEGIEILPVILEEVEIEDPRDVEELKAGKVDYRWDYVDESVFDVSEYMVTAYLESREEAEKINTELRERGLVDNSLIKEVGIEEADDSDWKDRWKEYFKTTKITDSFVIKPSWEEYKPEDGELVIDIDPGTAFGTGTHDTTSGCIKLLEKYMRGWMTVLDVGSGSGILSIAAALLGSENITAVDIDPEAVRVSRENVKINGFSDRVTCMEGDLAKDIDDKYDIVVANLMADLVVDLSSDVRNHLNPGGLYISSGILIEKEAEVIEALEKNSFTVLEVIEKGEWCAIAAG